MKQVSTAQPDGYFSLSSHVHKSHRRLRAPIGVSTSHQSPPPPHMKALSRICGALTGPSRLAR